jgi:hypothetical protein
VTSAPPPSSERDLELPDRSDSLRVNCFHIDGVLHVHTNRFAKFPRFLRQELGGGGPPQPQRESADADKIYALHAAPIDDDVLRVGILHDRGYWYAWNGITIVRFLPRE